MQAGQMNETPEQAWHRSAEAMRSTLGAPGLEIPAYRPPEQADDTPAQAWYRSGALVRAAVHQYGKLTDDDPRWGIGIPEYRSP